MLPEVANVHGYRYTLRQKCSDTLTTIAVAVRLPFIPRRTLLACNSAVGVETTSEEYTLG
jgi:hypothetical protein